MRGAPQSGFSMLIGATRSIPLIMQAAMAARNNSTGLKASGRPLTSVSSLTSASLQRAKLPCASVLLRHDVIFEHLRNPGFDPPGSALHDSNAGGVIRCDGSIDGSNNR